MFWLNFVSKLIGILHSGKDPRHLAAGFALGSIIGLTPFNSLHNVLVFLLILLLNVNISAAFFGIFVFSGFAFIFDPQFHSLGYFILVKMDYLKPCWTYLYNIPLAPLSRFYNTVVLGSLIVSLVLFFPIYFGFKHGVILYQRNLADKVNRLKIVQIIQGSNLFQLYNKIKSLGVKL